MSYYLITKAEMNKLIKLENKLYAMNKGKEGTILWNVIEKALQRDLELQKIDKRQVK